VKIFGWLATLWGGRIEFHPAMLFAIGFVATFTFGGITGVFLSAVPFDLDANGTYFVVAHIHYVLFGGSVFGLYAGLYYWWPKISGRMMNYKAGQWHFWVTFVSFNITFLPMHWLGLEGMPRRVAQYRPEFQFWNDVASAGSFVLALSTLIVIANMIWSMTKGKRAPGNPWHARTLEWMMPSPPPYYNFRKIPGVLALPYDFGTPLPYVGLDPEDSKGSMYAVPITEPLPAH